MTPRRKELFEVQVFPGPPETGYVIMKGGIKDALVEFMKMQRERTGWVFLAVLSETYTRHVHEAGAASWIIPPLSLSTSLWGNGMLTVRREVPLEAPGNLSPLRHG